MIGNFWMFLKANDAPNWVSMLFSLVVWPLALLCWNRRTIGGIPNLEVSLSKGSGNIGNHVNDAICLTFLNNTGAITYLTNVRILKCSKLFKVDPMASRDIYQSSHELKFPQTQNSTLTERQVILQTNSAQNTCLLLASQITDEMLTYKPCLWRRIMKKPKYFCLDYVVMVGNKRYTVSTIY